MTALKTVRKALLGALSVAVLATSATVLTPTAAEARPYWRKAYPHYGYGYRGPRYYGRRHHGGAIAAGVVGGLALGALAASAAAAQPAPVYGECYVVRRRVYDAYGRLHIRPVNVCD